jgi:PIN domain nuclease of toxin-antitoxin system
MLNLDTHILVFALEGKLTAKEEEVLGSDEWSVSAIVLWEIAKLCQLGRLEIEIDSTEFQRKISQIQIWPIDLAVCRLISHLDFKSDPADELIAATSLHYRIPLVTRDRRIRASKLLRFA